MKSFLNLKNSDNVLLITGEGCVNCDVMYLTAKEVVTSFEGLKFNALSVEDDKDLIESFKVEKVPCLILFKDGEEKGRCYGYQPDEILKLWLEAKLNN